MAASDALVRIWRVLVPALLLLSGLAHHHDSLEEAEHCDLCTTVTEGRRKTPQKIPVALLASGGRPGLEPAYAAAVSRTEPVQASTPIPVAVRPTLPRLVLASFACETLAAPSQEEATPRRGPPRAGSPRAPPTPA